MKRYPSISLLSLLFLLFIITCKREYSYEGGRPAGYSFAGTPDTCTGAIVLGDYYQGRPMAFNSVSLSAFVKSIGNYDIKTNTVNGIYFSHSGTFTDTGLQDIQLPAEGTPVDTGDFAFRIPGTEGCYFTVHVSGVPDAEFIIVGQPDACNLPVVEGTYQKGVKMTSGNTATVDVDVSVIGHFNLATSRTAGVTLTATGDFTTTGKQQVVLTAAGTPESSGLYHFAYLKFGTVCGFDVPVTNAAPYAVYVLQSSSGSGTACSPGSVQGTYTKGKELTGDNTFTVNAYVTQPGNYTISTQLADGIQFSASGTFTTAGPVDVVLYGTGTPVLEGGYDFYPQIIGPAPLGGEVCGLSLVVQP